MGRLPDNYIGPKQRIEMLKRDYPRELSAIHTTANMVVVGEALCILVKASIIIGDKVVAEGHAFTDCPEDDKAVEKAETIAIGRALVNAGYPELDTGDTSDEEGEEEEKPAKKAGKPASAGIGKKSSKEEDSDDEEESEEEEKPKARSGGLGSRLGGKAKAPKDEDSEDEADEETEEDSAEEEPKEAAKPAGAKMSREELLKKYGKK